MTISKSQLSSLRHPSETITFIISLVVVVPFTLLVIALAFASLGTFFILILVVVLVMWVVMQIIIASYLGNLVKVSELNFPQIAEMIDQSKDYFGYEESVEAYIISSASYNAYILPLLRKKVIILEAEMISSAASTDEVKWVIGRFVGALASKHYRFMWLEVFINSLERFQFLNLLLYPYERAVQLSGDQLGLVMIGGDVDVATRAMCKLMAGGKVGGHINVEGVLEQHLDLRGSFFGWLAKCLSPFPHNTERMANLVRFATERYPHEASTFVRSATDEGGRKTFARAIR